MKLPSAIGHLLQDVDEFLRSQDYGKEPEELYEPIRYLMALGGKRLRPMLVLLSGSLFKPYDKSWLAPASGVEVFHNFTLMHDDIMDAAPVRRGLPTVHTKWNNNVAILSGDVMLVCAYELIMQVPDNQLRNILNGFNRTAAEVCEGQQWDMRFETLATVSEEDYINMIRLKTAVLLGYSCALGGNLAQASAKDVDTLYQAGVAAGIGFQLMDDLLDVYGNPDKFGKRVGGDIVSNKKTFLLLNALKLASEDNDSSQLKQLNHLLQLGEANAEEKVAGVKEIYGHYGIKELTETRINRYFTQALDLLDGIPSAHFEAKENLKAFLLALMNREK